MGGWLNIGAQSVSSVAYKPNITCSTVIESLQRNMPIDLSLSCFTLDRKYFDVHQSLYKIFKTEVSNSAGLGYRYDVIM